MTSNVSRARRRPARLFLLPQILPMKPYVLGLISDLRSAWTEQRQLNWLLDGGRRVCEDYSKRRRRHDAALRVAQLRDEQQSLRAEIGRLGIIVGNVVRGEMLFPCLVDNRKAYFIWYVGTERPTHWRFRGERLLRPIPDCWFHLFRE
jgi:hypothetical protein